MAQIDLIVTKHLQQLSKDNNNSSSYSNNNRGVDESVFSKVFQLTNGHGINVNLMMVSTTTTTNNNNDQMVETTKEIRKLDSNLNPEFSSSSSSSSSFSLSRAHLKSNFSSSLSTECTNKEASSNKIISESFESKGPKEKSILHLRDGKRDSNCSSSRKVSTNVAKEKTDKKFDDVDNSTKMSENEPPSEEVDKNCSTFHCSRCFEVFPLSNSCDVERVCHHVGVGVAGNGSTNFSNFFRHFRFRVKLIVKPRIVVSNNSYVDPICRTEVSTMTSVSCARCPDVEFDIDSNVVSNLWSHLILCCEQSQVKVCQNFCIFCDQRVPDVQKHFDESNDVHLKRLSAMATCGCIVQQQQQDQNVVSKTTPSCKLCKRQINNVDRRLPEWVTSNFCVDCIVNVNVNATTKKSNDDTHALKTEVVFCNFCRQGKFGYTLNSSGASVCVDCNDIFVAYTTLKNRRECFNYVKGMLNELVSVPTFLNKIGGML